MKLRVRLRVRGYERSETEAQINEAAVVDTIMHLRWMKPRARPRAKRDWSSDRWSCGCWYDYASQMNEAEGAATSEARLRQIDEAEDVDTIMDLKWVKPSARLRAKRDWRSDIWISNEWSQGRDYERSETETQINEAVVVDTIMYLRWVKPRARLRAKLDWSSDRRSWGCGYDYVSQMNEAEGAATSEARLTQIYELSRLLFWNNWSHQLFTLYCTNLLTRSHILYIDTWYYVTGRLGTNGRITYYYDIKHSNSDAKSYENSVYSTQIYTIL